jgi:hypothetical protein
MNAGTRSINWPLLAAITTGVVLVLIVVGAIVGPSTPSSSPIPPGASSADVAFLRAMDARGINSQDGPQAEIRTAHEMCALLGQGYSINGLAEHYALTSGSNLSSDNMHYFIQTAAATYCPQHVR